MASQTRFVIDLTTEDELSDRRIMTISKELSDHLYLLGTEPEDEADQKATKVFFGHIHDATEDMCRYCRSHSRDGINGDTQHS